MWICYNPLISQISSPNGYVSIRDSFQSYKINNEWMNNSFTKVKKIIEACGAEIELNKVHPNASGAD